MASLDPTAPVNALAARPDVSSWLSRLPGFLRAEGVLVVAVAYVAILWTVQLRLQVAADTWLNLVGGKEIIRHGIPHHDVLAVMSQGREWIDQQWLSNIIYYAFYSVGGLDFVAQMNVLVFVTAIALALTIARRRGASAVAVGICALPVVVIAPAFARAEVLVQPLFVVLLALLAAESRGPTRRVLLALPILLVWANLHGSVVMAAALVAMLGACEAVGLLRRRRMNRQLAIRAASLMGLPWLCVFASPYNFHLISYYATTALNDEFPKFLSEWRPAGPLSPWGVVLILLAGWGAFLIGRRPRGLTLFELGALLLTMVAAATAARSTVWFTYAGLLLLPRLIQIKRRPQGSASDRNLIGATALAAAIAAVVLVGHSFVSPTQALAREQRQPALDSIARVLQADPNARVFASYDRADWVLFSVPEARGRIAYDGRWEILPEHQMAEIVGYLKKRGPGWERPSQGYRIIVLNPLGQKDLLRAYLRRPGLEVLYRDRKVAVFDRGPAADLRP